MQTTKKPDESGRLWIESHSVAYSSTRYGEWTCPLNDILIIGEYTSDHGPCLDDWFFVFVAKSGTYKASMYAKESESFREQLSDALGVDWSLELFGSTEFNSRVIWPSSLSGAPLFTFTKVQAPGLLRKIKLVMVPEVEIGFSEEAGNYLKKLFDQAL